MDKETADGFSKLNKRVISFLYDGTNGKDIVRAINAENEHGTNKWIIEKGKISLDVWLRCTGNIERDIHANVGEWIVISVTGTQQVKKSERYCYVYGFTSIEYADFIKNNFV